MVYLHLTNEKLLSFLKQIFLLHKKSLLNKKSPLPRCECFNNFGVSRAEKNAFFTFSHLRKSLLNWKLALLTRGYIWQNTFMGRRTKRFLENTFLQNAKLSQLTQNGGGEKSPKLVRKKIFGRDFQTPLLPLGGDFGHYGPGKYWKNKPIITTEFLKKGSFFRYGKGVGGPGFWRKWCSFETIWFSKKDHFYGNGNNGYGPDFIANLSKCRSIGFLKKDWIYAVMVRNFQKLGEKWIKFFRMKHRIKIYILWYFSWCCQL